MAPLPPWADEILACGETLPLPLLERIADRGERIRGTLLLLATDPIYRGEDAPGEGFAPRHAMDILEALAPDEDTARRLAASIEADPHAEEVDDLIALLASMGEVAVPALTAALSAAADSDAAGWLSDALVQCGVKDDAVLAALLAAFGSFPDELASSLGDYDDARVLPVLADYIDRHVVGEGGTAQHEEGCIAAAESILDLGGELTAAQEEKVDLAADRQNTLLRARIPLLEAMLRENEAKLRANEAELARLRDPRPKDPCPCGSGRKFKKCHEGDEEFRRRGLEGGDEDEP